MECYSDCLIKGTIWLNPVTTVLFDVCSVVFCTRVAWVGLLFCKEEGSSPVFCNY